MNKVENKIQETLESIRESNRTLEEVSIYSLIALYIQGLNMYIQNSIDGNKENVFENDKFKVSMESYLDIIIKCELEDLIYKSKDLPYEDFVFSTISKNENFEHLRLGEIKQMISHFKIDFLKFINDFIKIKIGC